MDNRFIIPLVPGERFLQRLTGATKVRFFVAALCVLMVSFDLRILLPGLVLQCVLLVSIRPNLRRIRFIIIFMIATNLINILLFFLADPLIGSRLAGTTTVLFKLNGYFQFTSETLWYFAARLSKIAGVFVASLWFALSITPSQLASGLYSLRLPYKLCTMVSLGLRYIPDILRDYEGTKTAMQMRGMELDPRKTKLGARLKQTSMILFPLIMMTFEKVGVIANAMELRGYGRGKKRSYYCEPETTRADIVFQIFALAVFLGFAAYVITGLFIPHPELYIPRF
ncbi:MAG: energy-coupling factor transporter transmembrane protein EcfT [Oscillospiraceae bacterium]|jgi:energy-coupling factor transport system permease protein|nr:energy-coupling factor transporter transmembrane protein EcfT [Oscillospiraceae bacterium]